MQNLTFFLALLAGCSAAFEPAPLFTTGTPEELALAERLAYEHLESDAARILAGVEGLRTHRVTIDRLANAHVRVDQTWRGLKVFGAQTIVHLRADGTARGLTEGWRREIQLDPNPALIPGEAGDRAVAATGGWYDVTAQPVTELMVLRRAQRDHLVYQVDVQRLSGGEEPSMPRVFVDAHTGEVVWQYDNLQSSEGHAVTPYNGAITFPVTDTGAGFSLVGGGIGTWTLGNGSNYDAGDMAPLLSADGAFTWDTTAADAHYGALKTRDYLRDVHGRDGIDGLGGPIGPGGAIPSGVHFGVGVANAFWTGTAMIYGDGDGVNAGSLATLDIAAHEMAHGVTEHTAGLIYQGESGALNESMSDVFGVLVEHHVRGPNPEMWLIGEQAWTPGTSGDALRYMSNPALDGASSEHFSTRYTGSGDNGGVHYNSGIANLSFFLVSEGGQHPNPAYAGAVQGIGVEKAGAIWVRGLSEYMTPSTTFAEARVALVRAAEDLFGPGSAEVTAVSDAWSLVGVGAFSGPSPEGPAEPAPGGSWTIERNGVYVDLAGGLNTFELTLPPGITTLRAAITGGTGDADLRVLRDGQVVCQPLLSGNEEACEVADPAAGVWTLELVAYTPYTGVQLTVESALLADAGDTLGLRAANEAPHDDLHGILDWRAADAVLAGRVFERFQDVDAEPYVGPSALAALRLYGELHYADLIVFGVEEGTWEAQAILDLVNTADVDTLDVRVGLDSRGVEALLEARANAPLTSLAELAALPFFAEVAFDRLLLWVTGDTSSEAPSEPTEPSTCAADEGDLGSGIGVGVASGDTCGAALDDTFSCGQVTGADHRFVWTAPYDGTFRFSTSGFDTVLAARTCDQGALACNDDDPAGGMGSSFALPMAAGESVVLSIAGYQADCGAYALDVTAL